MKKQAEPVPICVRCEKEIDPKECLRRAREIRADREEGKTPRFPKTYYPGVVLPSGDVGHAECLIEDGTIPLDGPKPPEVRAGDHGKLAQRIFEFGEERLATLVHIELLATSAVIIAVDETQEAHVILGHPLEPVRDCKIRQRGKITFKRGGPQDGYWLFTPSEEPFCAGTESNAYPFESEKMMGCKICGRKVALAHQEPTGLFIMPPHYAPREGAR